MGSEYLKLESVLSPQSLAALFQIRLLPIPVSHALLLEFAGSPLRRDLESLADGGEVSGAFRLESARLLLAPVVERTIEQPHALIHVRTSKRKVAPPYVSLTTRLAEIEQELKTHAVPMPTLEQSYTLMCDPDVLAKTFWLDQHPEWLPIKSQADQHVSKRFKVLGRLLYRCDLASRFLSRKRARQQHQLAIHEEVRDNARVLRELTGGRKNHTSLNELLSKLVLDHLRVVTSAGSMAPSPLQATNHQNAPD